MTETSREQDPADPASEGLSPLQRLSRRTTPTWEMELLVSGATVFGLLQLPGPLNALAQRWMYGNELELSAFLLVMAMYLQFSLVTLVATFVLHLLLRGYWVALVGLYSVYPQGIRWDDRRSFGPIYRRSGEGLTLDAQAQIEAADNRATKVFGLGFGVALSLLMPTALVGVFLVVMAVVQVLGLDLEPWFNVFWAGFGFLMLPFLVAYFLDRWRGDQLLAAGRAGPLLRLFDLYARLGMGRASNPLLALGTSQVGANRGSLYFMLGMAPVMLVISLSIGLRGRDLDNGAFDGLPPYEPGAAGTLHNGHYASLRDAGNADVRLPFLPDPFERGQTLRLFVPYHPARHNAMMRLACPRALSAPDSGEGLQCLGQLHALAIDGKPMGADWLGGRDPGTGQRGAWAMIDIAALPPGRHELVVQRLPRVDEGKAGKVPPPWRLPFWRQAAAD